MHRARMVPPVILAVVAVAGLAALGDGSAGVWAWGRPTCILSDARGEAVVRITAGKIAEAARRLHGQPSRPDHVAASEIAPIRIEVVAASEALVASPRPVASPFCLIAPRLTNLPPPRA
ncbi:MAG: hypothetical protein NTW19_08875 [Planctomycetota bacterium]|nr:hypothetical protein [Planctomycetota bacterium]